MKDYFPEKPWACRCGCGKNNIKDELVQGLNHARSLTTFPFIITSACRCEMHNRLAGGSPNSAHLDGYAVDILTNNSRERFEILEALMRAGFVRFGEANTFIHVDCDPNKPKRVKWRY